MTTDPTDPNLQKTNANGQQEDYLVLSEEERAKGFVRPVRRSYVHEVCGAETKMSQAIAETYARNPKFYGATFCVACKGHFALILPGGEEKPAFLWDDGTAVGS